MFGLLIAFVLVCVKQASNGLQDATNAADGEYQPHGFNLVAAVLCIAFLVLLAGAVGAGPLAGMVVTP
jgi:hypothetical protein